MTINEEGTETKHQVTTFADQQEHFDYVVDSMPDDTFGIADTSDANLENFFSRPIKTQSFTWAIGTTFFEKFNPWIDFFENKRVINRITNYNLLRCKLKCRIVLNGNGFYYGRAIASYVPLHNLDNFTQDRAFFIQDVVGASQRPHVYLDPTTSLGGTITAPFCWYENALRIPEQEWREMGDVTIHGIQDLKHANGSTDPITVSVFVWAEEVSLAVPTANEPGALTPQMGQKDDEYTKDGPISKPANFIAKVAGALEGIPPIAPFAKATHLAASAVSNVARIFGFSRPTILQDVEPYRPTVMGNMTNTNVGDSSVKLTLDGKQELTIDPRTMGLGGRDELAIKSIACRESYLTSFPWEKSASTETLLWNSEVSPVLWSLNEADTDNVEIHMPACCFSAMPFRFWRGSMKFRFQVVASAFHKGRLKVTYDPSYALSNEYNTNYTHIIDLAKERDFTVEVGWGHERSMVRHRTPGFDFLPYRETALAADPLNFANGIISVYVVNDLTTPNSTVDNDVQVNVFISAGDNIEFFDPDSDDIDDYVWFKTPPDDPPGPPPPTLKQQPETIYEPQMGEKMESHPDADQTKSENEPMKLDASEDMAAYISSTDNTDNVFFGDPIVSFRQCLKRYNYSRTWCTGNGGPLIGAFNNIPNFPLYRGYSPQGIDLAREPNIATPYNYADTTLLNYLTPAFVCRRGGMRIKYMRFGGSKDDLMYVTRRSVGTGIAGDAFIAATTTSANKYAQARSYLISTPHTWDGSHATAIGQNPVLEVELPYYNNVRFTPAKQINERKSNDDQERQFHSIFMTWDLDNAEAAGLHSFFSVGEDFQLAFFTGAPVCYRVVKGSDPTAQ